MTTATVDPSASNPASAPSSSTARLLNRRDLVFALFLTAAAVVVTFDAWRSIFTLGAYSEELSYVMLAPIMILWIAGSYKSRWSKCRAKNGWVGLLILAAGWAIFAYGFLADPVIWRAGAVVTSVGAFIAATGSDVLKKFLPVFGACIFLIPINPNGRYHLAQPLEVTTAQATQSACDLLGITVERSGNLLSINGVDVTVAEACNGMRMVITLFLVCYLVAFTSPLRPVARILLLAASPLVAIIANVVRLVPTVWLFGHATKETAESFHTAAGWGMIILSFLILMGLSRFIQKILTDPPDPKASATTKEADHA
jgi:exosortase